MLIGHLEVDVFSPNIKATINGPSFTMDKIMIATRDPLIQTFCRSILFIVKKTVITMTIQ